MAERGIAATAIRRIQRVEEFTETLPTVPQQLELDIEHQLSSGDAFDVIADAIEHEALDWGERRTSLIGLRVEIDQMFISSVKDVRAFRIETVRELDQGGFAADLRVTADMTYEFYVDKADAYAYKGDDMQVVDYDDNESFAVGTARRAVQVHVFVTLDSARHIVGLDVYNFIPLAEAGYWMV